MRIRRFETFLTILQGQNPSNPALSFFQDGKMETLTYHDLLHTILDIPLPPETSIGIFPDGTLYPLAYLFALACHQKQIVLLNPNETKENLLNQIKKGDVDKIIGECPYKKELEENLTPGIKGPSDKILFFTSGTTLANKAVTLTQQSLCASSFNGSYLLPLKETDSLLGLLPLNHVYGFVCSLLWGFNCGAKVCLSRGLRYTIDDINEYKPTVMSLVPLQAAFLTKNHLFNKELSLALIGAGDCRDEIIKAMEQSGIETHFGYGLTEASSGVALSLGSNPKKLTICPDIRITIAEDGEIILNSPTVLMEGYYKDPLSTELVLNGQILKTGDLGQIDKDGLLEIKGRKKDILVLEDGTKIFCPEYEMSLSKFLPDKDLAINLEDDKIVLYLGKSRTNGSARENVSRFNSSYPRSKQIQSIVFSSKPLPRTQTGKIQRWALSSLKQIEKEKE